MTTELIQSIAQLRDRIAAARRAELSVALVPTMGALHPGHAELIRRARQECACVVVSIFVNPLQFDRADDLDRYPRTLQADLETCTALGVDIVFAPSEREMYPAPPSCTVDVGPLADHLCGPWRPGHFRGVATVVLKLFAVVQPDRAYFGEKDAQQLAVIRHMVRDFNLPLHIAGVATVRDADGLALSSRNQRLSAGERQLATSLYRALSEVRRQVVAGADNPDVIKQAAMGQIPQDDLLRLEYFEIVDPDSIQPVTRIERPVLVAGAIWVGPTRLIDNVLCEPPG